MKNPKAKYILFPVVGIIWCLVLFRYLGVFDSGPAPHNPLPFKSVQINFDDSLTVKDRFELLLEYPDPFNGEIHKSERKITPAPNDSKGAQPALVPKIIQPGFDWRQVHFNGIVKIAGKEKSVCLLRIGADSFYAEAGNNYGGVDVIRIFPDSIWVKVDKDKRTLRR